MFYISIVCIWTKSEMKITDLAELSENCSRKGGASDKSAKSVIKKKIKHSFLSKIHGILSIKHTYVGAGLRRDAIAS